MSRMSIIIIILERQVSFIAVYFLIIVKNDHRALLSFRATLADPLKRAEPVLFRQVYSSAWFRSPIKACIRLFAARIVNISRGPVKSAAHTVYI
jgi:hypothetical protein